MRRRIKRNYQRVVTGLQTRSMPGFRGISIYDVFHFFIKGISNIKYDLLAAAMAYNFFFAMFPALIFLFTLIPYIPIENLQEEVIQFASQVAPPEGLILVRSIVDEAFKKMGIGLISVNLFLSMAVATRGFVAMMRAFAKDEEMFRQRNLFQVFGISLLIFFILALLFLIAIAVLLAGEIGIEMLLDQQMLTEGISVYMLRALNWLIILLCIFLSFSILYFMGAPTIARWRFFSPGSIIGGFLTLGGIFGFSYIIKSVIDFNKIYGSLSAIIILMVWFYWISIVLLIGFELNIAVDVAHARGKLIEKDIIK